MKKLPGREEILEWIRNNPDKTSKRDIAKAFGITGADRIELKRLLRELEEEGVLERRGRRHGEKGALPKVAVFEVLPPDAAGDIYFRPVDWRGGEPPADFLYIPTPGAPALAPGERVLARIEPGAGDAEFVARLIRRLHTAPKQVVGIFRETGEGGRIVPIEKGERREWIVLPADACGAKDGELVEAVQHVGKPRYGLPRARILNRLGDPSAPKAISLIAIHANGIPSQFPQKVLDAAEAAREPGAEGREDLRHIPFVTIDPADARDHDDAVCAMPDDNPKNPGGHVVWVAIADVAHFVRSGSALDREALKRGNSTYFPDRVVPMLPDRLSGDLCSLHEGVDRACIAVRMVIDREGRKLTHDFHRGIMRSRASLTYEETQAAIDGKPNERTKPLLQSVIRPLYAAYEAAKKERARRQPLDLDLPERRIVLDETGRVVSVDFRERFDAHRLIEEFMIRANVCAAETLEKKRVPFIYRVHEPPAEEKIEALREIAAAAGFPMAKKTSVTTADLNRLLHRAAGTEHAEVISISVLRSMTQAYYGTDNKGHFGLNLARYAHFTSPIRRYADLVVHRALISAHKWGRDGLKPAEIEAMESTAEHISETERRSMNAERETIDRYLAAYLADRVGAEFAGHVSGIARFGIFVKLDETGADGLIPIASIGNEYFVFDETAQTLTGERSGLTLSIGLPVRVKLVEAVPVTGGLMFELLEVDGQPLDAAGSGRGRRSRSGRARTAARSRARLGRNRARRKTARSQKNGAKNRGKKKI